MQKYVAYILLPCITFFNSAFSQSMAQKTNCTNAQWIKTNSGLLIWAKQSGNKGIQVDFFDNQLNNTASYSKSINGFVADDIELYYSGRAYFEFCLKNATRNQTVFIRLDNRLRELYVSPVISSITKLRTDSVFVFSHQRRAASVAYLRQDSLFFEISSERIQDDEGQIIKKTFFKKSIETGVDNFPLFQNSWKYELSSFDPEYAKVLFYDNERVFLYVNYNTKKDEQYIYCFNHTNGFLIYRAKLVVSKSDYWQVFSFGSQTEACIYSNHYYDKTNKTLLVSGSCIFSEAYYGLFILQLDENGAIISANAQNPYCLGYMSQNNTAGSAEGHCRNQQTYHCFVSMDFQSGDYFAPISETYSIQTKPLKNNKKEIEYVDNNFHFLALEKLNFTIKPAFIKVKCDQCPALTLPYVNNPHLDSVVGFIPKQTKLVDQLYANDINRISDNDLGYRYYAGSIYSDSFGVTKILMKDSVRFPSGLSEVYFTKTLFEARNQNCQPALSPYPLPNQDLKIPSKYFIRDQNSLFKLTVLKKGFRLETVKW
ncbi:MAG: hypothetical protein FD123_3432 [Bacteroidetes bacterium]|nr:MAG: hypothetical protein FD123_3432 [Bacteroidota bacterium]